MLEVDPGHYIVVATVGDRNVGFAAHLEVCGQPLFSGEWIEAGTFKSRSVLCIVTQGAITVGPHWSKCGGRDRDEPHCCETSMLNDMSGLRHESPSSPRVVGSPRTARAESLAKGTRLVSLRVVALPLVREVERERKPLLTELNLKLAEARGRVDAVKQVYDVALAELFPADRRGAELFEREISRTQVKLAELHLQKALKFFSMISMCRRVTHPYVYHSGEASSVPPIGQCPDPTPRERSPQQKLPAS
jgi:hypothetical protein